MHDPFEQFERSRAGFMIPMALLLAGMIPTALAIGAMSRLETDARRLETDARSRLEADAGGLEADAGGLEADRPVIGEATTDVPADQADSDSEASGSTTNPQDDRLP